MASAAPLPVLALLLCVCMLVVSSLPGVTARKELPLNTAFPPIVQNAIRCDVCSFIVANVLNHVEEKRDELHAKRLKLSEDDILEKTENMCIQFKDEGQWIRQVGLQVVPTTSKGSRDVSDSGYHLSVGVVDFYSRCGRTCSTVAVLCEELMDRDVMDAFPGQLLKISRRANMTDAASRAALFNQFCYPMQHCKNHKKYVANLDRALKNNAELRAELKAERPRKMKNEEREMETMLYRLTREQQQSADVFSRDDIRRMQNAFVHGSKEDVAAVDPKAFDLTDDEFESLREHMKAEGRFGGGGRHADDVDADL